MINRDDIEAGDKVHTRDGGCLVAYDDNGIWLGSSNIEGWRFNGDSKIMTRLDIIRIEKAPKPVVDEVWIGLGGGENYLSGHELGFVNHRVDHIIKLTIINGKLEKAEQVK